MYIDSKILKDSHLLKLKIMIIDLKANTFFLLQ